MGAGADDRQTHRTRTAFCRAVIRRPLDDDVVDRILERAGAHAIQEGMTFNEAVISVGGGTRSPYGTVKL